MPMYVATWQTSKDPKDKTGGEIYIHAMDDYSAGVEVNQQLAAARITKGEAFYIHFKECGGRTLFYNRGF